jgi:hypothetical protein
MSSTQASQTLFRFVSVRNPQLTDEEGKAKRFVYRPQEVKNQPATVNVFDAAIIAGSAVPKIQLLKTAAIAFKTSAAYLAKEADVKQLVGASMYDFSIWLARNRDSYINSELLTKAPTAGVVLNTTIATKLWNNLFYQVITQESFYVKEAIMQVLIANHVIVNLDGDVASKGITNNQTVARGTVILPKELFLETTNTSGIGLSSKAATTAKPKYRPATEEMKKWQNILSAKYYNKKYDGLTKSIKRIEQSYSKAYQEAYATAYKDYEKTTKSILERFAIEKDAALQNWCANRKVTDVSVAIDDPCNRPPLMLQPELPIFEFNFQSENDYLQERLTAEQMETINSIYSLENGSINKEASVNNKTISVNSFEDVYANLNRSIAQNNESIISNTSNEAESVVIIGGVPIAGTASRDGGVVVPFEYLFCPTPRDTFYVYNMSFAVPDSSWVFSHIEYTNLDLNTNPVFSTWIAPPYVGMDGAIYLGDLFGDPNYPFNVFLTYNEINGTLYFTNGKRKTFKIVLAGTNYDLCVVDIFKDPDLTGGGGGPIDPPADDTIAFKPSGFGVKQLGIADYKKVEQTVHCYVEGEVAHIENIMAREYKEKSTRRLRRSENTTTTSSESESEHLSDTTSTDRFEMQNEVAKVMQQSRDFSANANVTAKIPGAAQVTISAGANYATHNSKEESTRAAVTQAKDITERAMDRVVSRVKQERIEKIVEEFEENNKHGFDNTKGDKHVVGVYRWVDKIYKNQIYNYGKRLMFEFMIPEPAKLHYLGMIASKDNANGKVIIKPTDPRKANTMKMDTSAAVDEIKARYWAGVFNIDLDNKLQDSIQVSFAFSNTNQGVDANGYGRFSGGYSNNDFKIPDEYEAVNVKGNLNFGSGQYNSGVNVWGATYICGIQVGGSVNLNLNNIRTNLSISSVSWDIKVISGSLTATCKLTNEATQMWQQKTFRAIINGYEKALATYEDDLAQEAAKAGNVLGTNPGFYRDIENMVLRKNCISYLIDQSPSAKLTYGKPMFKTAGQDSFTDYEVNVTKDLDNYTAFAKFLEQAFEWNIMSYHFYPFYWGAKAGWGKLYQYDNNDPIFRSFMQSGLARVVVTVRPGFEDAVRFYMQTGLVWNGGEVPVIDDPLHLSIVDELKEAPGKPEGKAWATRIPTSLTILQADSIGLKVEKALPCNCDDVTADTWENPSAVPCGDNFVVSHDVLNGGNGSKNLVQFSFTLMDGEWYSTIQRYDEQKMFPRIYECMGQQIKIERDASWSPDASVKIIFDKLAEQLSLIPGVKAIQRSHSNGNPSGITFTIDAAVLPTFTFIKPNGSENYDTLKSIVTADNVRIVNPTDYSSYDKILDKDGVAITAAELNTLLPISRFKV